MNTLLAEVLTIKEVIHLLTRRLRSIFWLLLLSAALAAFQLFIHPLGQTFSFIFLGITLALFGLPHGALDHRIEAISANSNDWSLVEFLKSYCLKILITCVIWVVSPSAGFIGFLLFSGYHFGETDLRSPEFKTNPNSTIITLYGLAVLGCLLSPRMTETWEVLEFLSSVFSAKDYFTSFLSSNSTLVWFLCFSIVFSISVVQFLRSPAAFSTKANLFIPALVLIFLHPVPLLTAFSFYFGLWHSLHALKHIRTHLHYTNTQMVREAFPFSIISIMGLVLFILLVLFKGWSPVLLIFIFISALTTPHVGIMRDMYDKSQLSTPKKV